jgi:hypothetical protein
MHAQSLLSPTLHAHRLEVAEKSAELELQRAEAVASAVRAARGELALLRRAAAPGQRGGQGGAPAAAAEGAVSAQAQPRLNGGWTPAVGETVFVPRLKARARVVAIDSGGLLTLQVGVCGARVGKGFLGVSVRAHERERVCVCVKAGACGHFEELPHADLERLSSPYRRHHAHTHMHTHCLAAGWPDESDCHGRRGQATGLSVVGMGFHLRHDTLNSIGI